MAKELNIDAGTTGLTVTANVYLLGVANVSGIACAEIGVTGKYSGNFSASPNVAGVYQVAFFDGGTVTIGGGQIVWDGAAEVAQTGDAFARLPAALVGGRIDANVGAVKGTTVGSGVGTAGNPWGP